MTTLSRSDALPPVNLRLPANASQADLELAYAAGLKRRHELVDGAYYLGHCRNASVARWSGQAQMFVHWRHKFGQRYLEDIAHPADESRYDVFVATVQVEPLPGEAIPDTAFEAYVEDVKAARYAHARAMLVRLYPPAQELLDHYEQPLPRVLDMAARYLWLNEVPESADTHALRRALRRLDSAGVF